MARPIKNQLSDTVEARQALLNAAVQLFAEQGYSATGVQQITDVAGVNKAMLYYYFASKDGVYDLLVADGIRAVEEAVKAAEVVGLFSIQERLRRFVCQYLTAVVDNPGLARILFREVMGGGERHRVGVVEHFSQSIHRLALLCEQAREDGELRCLDASLLAYSFFGMATMFIASHFVTGRVIDATSLTEHIVELFFHGAALPTQLEAIS